MLSSWLCGWLNIFGCPSEVGEITRPDTILVIVTSDPPCEQAQVHLPLHQWLWISFHQCQFEARLKPDVRPLSVITNDAWPRCPTDIIGFIFSKWKEPAEPQLMALLAALAVFLQFKTDSHSMPAPYHRASR